MPPMPPEDFCSRDRFAEQQGIVFLGPIEPESWPAHWPETRRRLFNHIVNLGDLKFGTFEASNSDEMPWRAQIKQRAVKLAYLARRCGAEGKNESSWRFSLEHEVLNRFTVEVSCPTCRARLWRSEVEADVELSDAQALSLDERRRKRTACRCSVTLGPNQDFHGVNMIFSDRAETSIHYNPPLPIRSGKRTKKRYEQPDRVYGLIETQNIKELLDSPYRRTAADGSQESVRDTLEASPFKGDRKPLLFPFLLVEAKSDTIGDTAGLERQSAFTIRRLITIQDELRAATGKETSWLTGPLVWFFGWHGEDWYVRSSFIDDTGPSQRYCILDLWQGNIRKHSSALQLLLIVDYIFDWARDGYRPTIIKELSTLAGSEMQVFDPDIFSTGDPSQSQLPTSQLSGLSPSQELSWLQIDPSDSASLNVTRPPLGVVRDASNIESRFLGLCISETDVDEFWDFMDVESSSEASLQGILKSLQGSWRVTGDTLSFIQACWSERGGAPNAQASDSADDQTFHVKITISFHVADDWTPIQQLTYLAVSERALRLLLLQAHGSASFHMPEGLQEQISSAPTVGASQVEPFIASIKRQSIVGNLTAAIDMLCMSSTVSRTPGRIPVKWRLGRSDTCDSFVGFVLDSVPSILAAVVALHDASNKALGDALTNRAAWAISSRDKISLAIHTAEPCLWQRLDPICHDGRGCALVDGLSLPGNNAMPAARFCLFIISRYDFGGFVADIPGIIQGLAEGGLYYSTLLLNSNLQISDCSGYLNRLKRARLLWRAADSLGLLMHWIEDLESQPQRPEGPGQTPDSPILIPSGEESEVDPMDEDC
ncbi:uncharacterized protein BDV14DRAFT_210694 [Aspergillus stella-maris]|uniref:uncharacterized protein n=1 Tax=Aspergillus stella-maris TaxID=1810926 RepID=UPI003CCDDD3D